MCSSGDSLSLFGFFLKKKGRMPAWVKINFESIRCFFLHELYQTKKLHFLPMFQQRESRCWEGKKRCSDSDERRIEQDLENVYFDPSSVGGLGSPYRLYKETKKLNPDVTVNFVRKWLEKKPEYTLHREVVLKFPRRKVIVRGPLHSISS